MKTRISVIAVVLLSCAIASGKDPEPAIGGRTLSQWIEQTKHPAASSRECAAMKLRDLGHAAKPAVPALVKLLADSSPGVRQRSAEALGAIGPDAKDSVGPLIKLLGDSDGSVREATAEAIGKIGPAANAAVPALVKATDDGWWSIRREAVKSLGQIGREAKAAVPALIEIAKRKDAMVNRAALEALAKIGPDARTADAAAELMVDWNDSVADAAMETLVAMSTEAKNAVPTLEKHLEPGGANYYARKRALEALGRLGPIAKPAVPKMAELLYGGNCCRNAFDALASMGPSARSELPQLVAFAKRYPESWPLQDKDLTLMPSDEESVRAVINWKCGPGSTSNPDGQKLWNVLSPDDIPCIVPMLHSSYASDRTAAIEALRSFGPAAIGPFKEMLRDPDAEFRCMAIRALSEIGTDDSTVPHMLGSVLHDTDSHVRSTAAIALGQFGRAAKAVGPMLTEAINDKDCGVRICAVEALGRIGPNAAPATAALGDKLKEEFPAVRSAAARALGQIGPAAKAAVPALERLRRDRQDYVREAATKAVAAITSDASDKPKP